MVMRLGVLSPFIVMIAFLWEEGMDAVGEKKWWNANFIWDYIYDSNGINFWVFIHDVTIPKSGFRYNELSLTRQH